VRSMPSVAGIETRYAPRGLRVIGLHEWNDGEDVDAVARAMHEHGATWPTYLDVGGRMDRALGDLNRPAFYVIGRDGSVVFRWRGGLQRGSEAEATLAGRIERALSQS